MFEAIIRFFAAILIFIQSIFAPLASVAAVSLASSNQAPLQTSSVLSRNYMTMSPTVLTTNEGQKHLWFSGLLTPSSTPGVIYHSAYANKTWQKAESSFSIPGFRLSDPSVIEDPSNPGQYLMFYTQISSADAASTTLAKTRNHIGMARSKDGSFTWQNAGLVIDQNNKLDGRGGWAPSAVVVGDEIWLYYSTNYPGAIQVYRSRVDTNGKVLNTEKVFLQQQGGPKQLEGFNVEVLNQNGNYSMYLNTDYSAVKKYTSEDGLEWALPQGSPDSLIKAAPGSLIAAPATELVSNSDGIRTTNLYFAAGATSTASFDSIYVVNDAGAIPTQETYVNPLAGTASAFTSAATSTNAPNSPVSTTTSSTNTTNSSSDQNNSSGGSTGIIVGVLGIAAIVGLIYLSSGTAAAEQTGEAAASVAINPVSFGGTIVAWLPCLSVLGPSFWVTLKPASPLVPPYMYIWTPGTFQTLPVPILLPPPLMFFPGTPAIPSVLPPTHIGQSIMGRFDIPYWCCIPPSVPAAPGVCVIPATPPIPVPPLLGLRMQVSAVSP